MGFLFALKGTKGEEGDPGDPGDKGDKGDKGDTGEPGALDYADRGDPSSHDFTTGDFTKDSAWHDLDLSGIIAENAVAVILRIDLINSSVTHSISVRKKGNSNTKNLGAIFANVSNVPITGHFIVAVDNNRKVEYMSSTTGWGTINITVVGWFV